MREKVISLIVELLFSIDEVKKLFDIAEWEIYNEKYLRLEELGKRKFMEKQDLLTKIKCPGCGVIYETPRLWTDGATICVQCKAEYMQPIHDINNPEYIRQAAYRCRVKNETP